MFKKFLDLGQQPLANSFIKKKNFHKKEKRFISKGGIFLTHIPKPRLV